MPHTSFQTLQTFKNGKFYSLPQLEKERIGPISRLPVSIWILLESVLRNLDGVRIKEQDVRALANWKLRSSRARY